MTTGRTSRTSAFALLLAWSALFVAGVTTLHAQDFAVQSLEDSPRHHEWVEVQAEGRAVHSFVAHPETDERVNATIPETESRVERYGKTYDVEVYEGVGHAFMRAGADPEASATARAANDAAFQRVLEILAGLR